MVAAVMVGDGNVWIPLRGRYRMGCRCPRSSPRCVPQRFADGLGVYADLEGQLAWVWRRSWKRIRAARRGRCAGRAADGRTRVQRGAVLAGEDEFTCRPGGAGRQQRAPTAWVPAHRRGRAGAAMRPPSRLHRQRRDLRGGQPHRREDELDAADPSPLNVVTTQAACSTSISSRRLRRVRVLSFRTSAVR
jgi:hypothetical protein